ncbi:MAG: arsenite methyltransferase [Myxococcales bacterium]|nr:arsenite methyltransferase [Myxococcales bacterium]
MTEKAEQTRSEISKRYSDAIQKTSCCAPSCCAGSEAKAPLAKTAGYRPEELAEVGDVAESSFGCGNPLAFSEVREGDVVLDLGSGAGLDLLIASKKAGPSGRVIGIDMTDAMIERARANVAKAGVTNVEVRKGLIEALPVEDASVDWVISNCVINLSPEKERVFAEIARVLKPGGRMLVSDIVVDAIPDWFRENAAMVAACIGGAISESEYLAGLERAGLTDVAVRSRLVYDADQLESLTTESELPEVEALLSCCNAETKTSLIKALAPQVAGKVASISVFARRAADASH